MDSDDFDEQMGESASEDRQNLFRDLVEQIEARCQKVGLYTRAITVHPDPNSTDMRHPERFVIIGHFTLGDLAFAPRVQNPEQAQVDDEFRGMQMDAEEAEWEELRKRHERGELGWRPKDD
jgi:hypothetical protein